MSAPVRIIGIALVTLVFCAGTAQAARTYKWVDEDGVTHYSQYPPPDGEAQIIEPSIGIPTGTTDSASGSETAGGDEEGTERASDDGPQTVEAYCKQLREQAQMLASDRDVRIRQEDGTLEPLAGDSRAQKRAEISQQIERNC